MPKCLLPAVPPPAATQVNADGVKANITWSSSAMASVACKQDMDAAVLEALNK